MIGNIAHSDDYRDGEQSTVAARYEKLNGGVVFGWILQAYILLELTVGRGYDQARYASRSIDGQGITLRLKTEFISLRITILMKIPSTSINFVLLVSATCNLQICFLVRG